MLYENFTLEPFQRDTVNFIIKHRYCIVALDPGMGKTISSLVAAMEVNAKRILVVCPAYLMINWKREIKKFFPEKYVTIFSHHRDFCTPFDSDIAIISYSFLNQADELFEWAQVLIVDEAQALKNMDTIRGDAAHIKIFENSIPRVMLLSGTIMENNVAELHSPLTIMHYNPKEKDLAFLTKFPTYVDFANRFSNLTEFKMKKNGRHFTVKKWTGIKKANKQELRGILKRFTVVKRFRDHIKMEDPVFIDVLASEIDNPALLADFEKFFDTMGDKISSEAKAKSALSKAKITANYVKTTLKGATTVVYTCHIESAKAIASQLNCPYVDGSMPVEKRQKLADELNNGGLQYLVATSGSFSTGINLHEKCSNLVLNDYPWKPSELEQIYGRIVRRGQLNQCYFHNIYASPQDEYISKLIKEKAKTTKEVMEGL